MKIFVKTLKGICFDVEVKPEDRVVDLKNKIEIVKGVDVYPAAQQMLVYQGKVLNDDNATLLDNQVSENSFVVIMSTKNRKKPSGSGNCGGSTVPTTISMAPQTRPPAAAAVNNLEATVQQILDMGGGNWDRDLVVGALIAANNNPERAVDYLCSGIPEHRQAGVPPFGSGQPANPPTQPPQLEAPSSGPNTTPLDLFPRRLLGNMGSASDAAASVGTSRIDFLRNIPQFQVLRAMVQANPQLLQHMLQQSGRRLNPEQARLIQENQADFLRLINESAIQAGVLEPEGNIRQQQFGGGGGAMPMPQLQPQPQPQVQAIRVTAEEREAIERLEAMGFNRALVLEAFFACNRNEQLAANYLLDHMHDFDE